MIFIVAEINDLLQGIGIQFEFEIRSVDINW